MHRYLRMYWAKRVIEWTPNFQHAFNFLLEQNDKYELDGNDPIGYARILWCFGLHDRAHAVIFEFQIGVMNESRL